MFSKKLIVADAGNTAIPLATGGLAALAEFSSIESPTEDRMLVSVKFAGVLGGTVAGPVQLSLQVNGVAIDFVKALASAAVGDTVEFEYEFVASSQDALKIELLAQDSGGAAATIDTVNFSAYMDVKLTSNSAILAAFQNAKSKGSF